MQTLESSNRLTSKGSRDAWPAPLLCSLGGLVTLSKRPMANLISKSSVSYVDASKMVEAAVGKAADNKARQSVRSLQSADALSARPLLAALGGRNGVSEYSSDDCRGGDRPRLVWCSHALSRMRSIISAGRSRDHLQKRHDSCHFCSTFTNRGSGVI
jgi:hypothetical protein